MLRKKKREKKCILFPLTQRIWRISGSHTCMFWSMSTNMQVGECTGERTKKNTADRKWTKRTEGKSRDNAALYVTSVFRSKFDHSYTQWISLPGVQNISELYIIKQVHVTHEKTKKQAAAYGSPLRHNSNNTRTYCASGVDFSPTESVPWNDRSGCWSSGAFILCSSCVCSIVNFTTYHVDILSICF